MIQLPNIGGGQMQYQPIEHYGVIGDLHTVALVGRDASIDYMCFPKLDSPSIFARLLDFEKGGYFQLRPLGDNLRKKQLYLSNSAVLFTRFLSPDGVAEISDFMPVTDHEEERALIRRAKAVRGQMTFEMICEPAFDYGRSHHEIEKTADGAIFHSLGGDGTILRLRTNVPLKIHSEGKAAHAIFELNRGETATFILENAASPEPSPYQDPGFAPSLFRETVNYWRAWIGQSKYQGRWREIVNRSAMILKLLTSKQHGSIAAAATYSLPEEIGGERNWDYRYTWIRDASFTLYALTRLGFTEEPAAFMHWIEARCKLHESERPLQVMYRLNGSSDLDETTLDHFEGYMGSSPVRIGNGAATQLQLDIYGELFDSVYLYDKYGEPISHQLWVRLVRILDWLEKHWDQPDEGIWEVRGGRQHFLFSRLMCWVAFDRAIRLSQKRSLPGPIVKWLEIRDEIYKQIHTQFWNPVLGAFVQHLNTDAIDASSLLMPLVRFISPTDPRWLKHLQAVEDHLVYDSLVYRYDIDYAASDGLLGDEGTFSMCTFWFVECLARAGDLDRARFYFEKMLGYANHVGLYAEELGLHGEHLGNFPQAFTHLALISAAYDLDRRLNLAGHHG
jgi:GH15 family glucan-1,4-alpha-glucosidase